MQDSKINNLTELTTANSNDALVIEDNTTAPTAPTTKKIKWSSILAGILSAAGINSGMITLSGTPGTAGQVGYASGLLKFFNGSAVKTVASTDDVNAVLPTQTGNNGKVLGTNGSAASWVSGPAFTNYAVSSGITITAAGSWSWTHGLGAAPKGIQLWLKNTSAEFNYSPGDMVVALQNDGGTANRGAGAAVSSGNTTTVDGRFGSLVNSFAVLDKTTGNVSIITNTKWQLVVAAWV